MKKELITHFTWLANRLAEINTYNMYWSTEFKEKHIKETFDTFYKSLQCDTNKHLIDISKITIETAKEMRFKKCDENSDLYLFPLWFKPLIPIGTEVTAIDGDKIIYNGENLDDDMRFGCLAYGIELKE